LLREMPVTKHGKLRLKCDGTHAETRFRLSAKRTSPFKSAGASVQSTTGSRGVRICGSNAGYTMFRGSVKDTGSPLHSPVSPSLPPPSVSPRAITFQLDSTKGTRTSRRVKSVRFRLGQLISCSEILHRRCSTTDHLHTAKGSRTPTAFDFPPPCASTQGQLSSALSFLSSL
jgi:hypothetical protein